jgi:hypothetical protein
MQTQLLRSRMLAAVRSRRARLNSLPRRIRSQNSRQRRINQRRIRSRPSIQPAQQFAHTLLSIILATRHKSAFNQRIQCPLVALRQHKSLLGSHRVLGLMWFR